MLLWYVLAGILILIAWALWWVLGMGTSVPILATLGVLLALGAVFLAKWLIARRNAQQLENALTSQANQQALNARPERRAEIQELQRQLAAGIEALKRSRAGRGGQRGAGALYSMPWYMIIGPPGAGKTTALKHSGMVFPFSGGQGGGVRGVGGTRNCDWWFTNEAILLDTAGRYTTEADDRDEWLSFLAFLRKYRPQRPINGVIVALSISELVDASEQQVEVVGKKLRARIDEVMTNLQMVVPVYVLFTKIDLVAGFSEFFGDLKKSDRSQPWGATLRLDLPKNEPGRIFDAEFDALMKHLHARGLRRMVLERSREGREKVYQFPLEFAGLKKNLSDLMAVTFAPNSFQGTPILRGFYFTSGTQEGRPLDRVLGRMSAAMGIRPADTSQQQAPVVESKSYFLHDVFMNVMFPDGNLAARSASEERRQLVMRLAIAGATLVLAAVFAIPAFSSYLKNKDFLRETERRATLTAGVKWNEGPASAKFPPLVPTLEQLKTLDQHEAEGVPLGMGWMMYSANRVQRPALMVYVAQIQKGFTAAAKQRLEERLKVATGERYLEDRTTLKMYLMLADQEHLDVEWATGRYTRLWAEILKPSSDISDSELRKLASPHVAYYFDLLKRGKVAPLELDQGLIQRVRESLQAQPIQKRYYDLFVNSLKDELFDEAADPTIDNLMFAPVQLPRVFTDRAEVLKVFESKRYKSGQGFQEVEGPYTEKGHAAVVKQIEAAEGLLKTESWVVPLTKEESPALIPKHVKGVGQDYQTKYIQQWRDFFADIAVRTPTTTDEAIELYRVISTTEYPVRRLLQLLEDHTQWKNANPLEGNSAIAREANRRFNQKLNMYTYGIVVNVDLRQVGKELDVIPNTFKSAVSFAAAGKGDSRVFQYAESVKKLRESLIAEKNRDPQVDIRKFNDVLDGTRRDTEQLIANGGFDETAKSLLRPLLLTPLTVGATQALGAPGVDPARLPPNQRPPTQGTPPGSWSMPTFKQ